LCSNCHQDYVGPWIYEHAPAAEDCTMCHDPHGAASFNLLDTSQPALCLACHTSPDDMHFLQTGEPGLTVIQSDFPTGSSAITSRAAGAFYTRCTDCHMAIHGSYGDPHLRR
jgi:predicted CXXCH cytochrome family protein